MSVAGKKRKGVRFYHYAMVITAFFGEAALDLVHTHKIEMLRALPK